MSTRFAAWLHVTPSPTTLAESSAVYQALRKHGRMIAFARSEYTRREQEKGNTSSSTFYTVFPQEPATLKKSFSVPVYQNVPNARDEDPFNIRGLQGRKPMPAPKTFTCMVEAMAPHTARFEDQAMIDENPYHGHFKVSKQDWLREVLLEINAPPGIPRGCANMVNENESSNDVKLEEYPKRRKINMRSLMAMWNEAKEAQQRKESTRGKRRDDHTGRRLFADKPIGML